MLVEPVPAQATSILVGEPTPRVQKSSSEADMGAAGTNTDSSAPAATKGRFIVQLNAPSLVAYSEEIEGMQITQDNRRDKILFDDPNVLAYLTYFNSEIDRTIEQASGVIGRDLANDIVFRYDVLFGGFAIEITEEEASAIGLLESVKAVSPDHILWPDTDLSPTWLGTNGLWDGANVPGPSLPYLKSKGEGVLVGILDTGINMDHPSFAATGPVDRFVHTNPFGPGVYKGLCVTDPGLYVCNDKLAGVYSYITTAGALLGEDDSSHGSHTASTAAGNVITATYGDDVVTISGMAPHANIIAYDVCDLNGCPSSASLAAAQQALRDGVDVINFSLGPKTGSCRNPYSDPVDLAFLEIVKAGGVVSTSAGNGGPSSMTTLKGAPWEITVANTGYGRTAENTIDPQSADILSQTSSRGPFVLFDVVEPELAAPGTNVLAACATSNPSAPYGVADSGEPVEIILKSGTSMASPHVAGNAALLRSLFPSWSGMEIKSALIMTALAGTTRDYDLSSPIDAFDYGNGRLDMTKAALTGLVMHETYVNMMAANPATGGDVRTLNLPSYQNSYCLGICRFTRTFRSVANVEATYTGTVDACTNSGVVVSINPATFTIPPGGTQSVTIAIDATKLPSDQFGFGRVSFKTSNTFSLGEPISSVAIPFTVKWDFTMFPYHLYLPLTSK